MTFEDLFALRAAGADRWAAPGPPDTDEPRLFGGLLLGHAIVAVSEATKPCHALHALFVGAGSKREPLDLAVTRTRDGRSYATRHVELRQQDRLLLVGFSSHHGGDDGPEHAIAMPDVPPPETLEDQYLIRVRQCEARGIPPKRHLVEELLDIRPVELPLGTRGVEGRRAIWFRPRQPLSGDQTLHKAVIAFASDVGLVHVGLLAHIKLGDGARLQATSLDHSLWFHREAPANDWMLHVQRSPIAAHGRGLSHAAIFTRAGQMVASAAQEFLARRKRDPQTPTREG
jgi:acyl-CoA thioesterase-2